MDPEANESSSLLGATAGQGTSGTPSYTEPVVSVAPAGAAEASGDAPPAASAHTSATPTPASSLNAPLGNAGGSKASASEFKEEPPSARPPTPIHGKPRPYLGRPRSEMPKSKFDDFEALNGVNSASIVKTQELFDHARLEHARGEHHTPHHARWERWLCNACIGIACGLTSFFLKMCIEFLANTRGQLIKTLSYSQGHSWVPVTWFCVLVFAGVLCLASAAMIIFVEPNAAGSGIPETSAFLNGVIIPKTFSISVLKYKFLSCALAVGSGLPVGPEGPMIHMGSVIGSLVSQVSNFPSWLEERTPWVKLFRNVGDRRDFMAAGVAGGVSAAFAAPIGGLLFVAEEIASHWDVNLGMQVFLCSVCACTTVEILTSSFDGFQYMGSFGMIRENSAILFDVNAVVPVNVLMFIPTVALGAIGGLFGALFNTIILKATAFRGAHIKPHRTRFLLEPVGIALVYVTAMLVIPTFFGCVRSDCDEHSTDEACLRVGDVDDETEDNLVPFGCGENEYNPSASLFVPSGEHIVKSLFSRGFYYQYDYLPLLAMLLVYLPTSAYSNGIACSTGIVIPCLLNGALIGRIFGLLMTDLMGQPGNDPSWAWVDPGAFALLGAAGFFAGVARITMALTVIITELTNDTHFILPIMVAIMVGKWTADLTGVHPIYHSLMHKKNLPYLTDHPHVALPMECFAVGQVSCSDVVCVHIKVSLKQLAELLTNHKHNAFPVTVQGPSGDGQRGQFIGMVRREHLVALSKSPSLWTDTMKGQAGAHHKKGERGDSNRQLSLEEIFELLDLDGDGELTKEEVVSGAAVLKMTPAEAAALFDELDKNGTGALSREEFSHLNTDELSTQELKAFDAPEELSSAALDQELRALTHPGNDRFEVDLKPYVDCSAFTVNETFSLRHAYDLFRSMGLRHLVVTDAFNCVAGIVTRHNLMEANLNQVLTERNIRSPEDLLEHYTTGTNA